MKIAFITIYPKKAKKHSETGGVASYSKNLITKLPLKVDDDVYVICDKNHKKVKYKEDGVNVIRCFDKNPKYIYQISKELIKLRPDTIHIQQEMGLFGNIMTAYLLPILLLFCRIISNKIVITLHGVVDIKHINKDFIYRNNSNLPIPIVRYAIYIMYKPLILLSQTIIVHEEYFKNILINGYSANPNKIHVIYHGIEDLKNINKIKARKHLDIKSDANVVLFMGYLTGYKGLDILIEGFSEYVKHDKNAFFIIGAGKHPKLKNDQTYNLQVYKKHQEKALQLIPHKNYVWAGFIIEKEIVDYYSAADLSIYPYTVAMSSSGPMSISIGYELPFIASAVFKEILNKKILFPLTSHDISNKISDFFINQSEYAKIVKEMQSKRLWSYISAKTYKLYAR